MNIIAPAIKSINKYSVVIAVYRFKSQNRHYEMCNIELIDLHILECNLPIQLLIGVHSTIIYT